jgi:hypothetical protein
MVSKSFKTIMKANRALCTIRLIKEYFKKEELFTLLTANFYSILYYNPEIWHLLTLNQHSKHLLLPTSAKALTLCIKSQPVMYSYSDIHTLTKRATQPQIQIYKHAILLVNLYNSIKTTSD